MKELKWSKWLLSVGILCVFAAPFILTRSFGLFSFNDTGPIGDTIGGITSPITSLIGSVLVFFALKAQIDANELVRQQFEQQRLDDIERKNLIYLSEQVNIIRSDINDFGFVHEKLNNDISVSVINYRGASAFDAFVSMLPDLLTTEIVRENPFDALPTLMALRMLLEEINNLMVSIANSSVSKEDKTYMKSLLSYQYLSKIRPAFSAKLHQYKMMPLYFEIKLEELNKESVFSNEIFALITELDKKTSEK